MTIERVGLGPRMSQAVVHNGVVYLAGQVAEDASQDVEGQTRQILQSIDTLLAEVGSDKTRLLQVQIFLADINDFSAMNTVWDAWVSQRNAPARATTEARLAAPALKVEILATAAV
ncbi:MAG: RidA family protein [Pigmentiphaga sp.]